MRRGGGPKGEIIVSENKSRGIPTDHICRKGISNTMYSSINAAHLIKRNVILVTKVGLTRNL